MLLQQNSTPRNEKEFSFYWHTYNRSRWNQHHVRFNNTHNRSSCHSKLLQSLNRTIFLITTDKIVMCKQMEYTRSTSSIELKCRWGLRILKLIIPQDLLSFKAVSLSRFLRCLLPLCNSPSEKRGISLPNLVPPSVYALDNRMHIHSLPFTES